MSVSTSCQRPPCVPDRQALRPTLSWLAPLVVLTQAVLLWACCCGFELTFAAEPTQPGEEASAPLRIRVGIHTYAPDGILMGNELQRYRELFSDVAGEAERNGQLPIHLQAATGSYADVYHWCKNDLIDVAVVPAGVYSLMAEHLSGRWVYLCTMGQGDRHDQFEYGVRCVAQRDSPLQSLDQIRAAHDANQLTVYLVDEHSTSGGILPRAFLQKHDIVLRREEIVYTGSHAASLTELARGTRPDSAKQDARRAQIAFVCDGAMEEGLAGQRPLRAVPMNDLTRIRIPESAVVVRDDFYNQNREFLDKLYDRPDFERVDDFAGKYGSIEQWRKELSMAPPSIVERTDWQRLFDHLIRYTGETQKTPRVALVLAGGGAKCAFQVGVIENLERRFQDFRQGRFREFCQSKGLKLPDCDISLVVGTSGGAINALPVALGVYTSPQGIENIKSVWSTMDIRDILQPELPVRCGVGVLLFLLHFILMLLVVRLRWRGRRIVMRGQRGRIVAVAFLVLGVANLCWWFSGWKLPWSGLSFLHHSLFFLWALVGAAQGVLGLLLAAAGLTIGGIDQMLRRRGRRLTLSAGGARETIAWLTLVSLALAIPVTLQTASHFSESHGLEQQMAKSAELMVNERLARRGSSPIHAKTLSELSQLIINRGLLEKDLIITATILADEGELVPDWDVYFYAAAGDKQKRLAAEMIADSRFRNLEAPPNRRLLLDAVLGSGAVFPVFPARKIQNYPGVGSTLRLVDGSYSHHSPIEAAVRWGATHLILVDPSPAVTPTASSLHTPVERTLYENSLMALGHLFDQAQNVDRQAQGQTTILTINPEKSRHQISLLSFAEPPIRQSIQQAKTDLEKTQEPFQRRLSRPFFLRELETKSSIQVGGNP